MYDYLLIIALLSMRTTVNLPGLYEKMQLKETQTGNNVVSIKTALEVQTIGRSQ